MKEEIKLLSFLILTGLFLAGGVFAMDIPVFSLIISENSSGYVCPGSSIGCSSLSSIYKIEKRGENIYVCPGGSIGGCSPLDTFYKTSKYSQKTTYICPSTSFGSCSAFNLLYKISKESEDMNYVCPGNSIGDCSIFNVLYKVSKYSKDTTFVCPGNSIGKCSIFNVLYKFKKDDLQLFYYPETDPIKPIICPLNSTYINGQCVCNEGYIWGGSGCITYTQSCQSKYGPNSYGDKQYCYCSAGYEWNASQTACIKSVICPLNSTKINNVCVCNEGYEWNVSRTACMKTEIPERKEEIIRPIQEQQIQQEKKKEKPVAILGNEKEISDEIQEVFDTEIKEDTQELQESQEQEEEKQDSPTLIRSIFNAIRNFFSRVLSWF